MAAANGRDRNLPKRILRILMPKLNYCSREYLVWVHFRLSQPVGNVLHQIDCAGINRYPSLQCPWRGYGRCPFNSGAEFRYGGFSKYAGERGAEFPANAAIDQFINLIDSRLPRGIYNNLLDGLHGLCKSPDNSTFEGLGRRSVERILTQVF